MNSFHLKDLVAFALSLALTASLGIQYLAALDRQDDVSLCQDRLRTVAIACSSYHEAFNALPYGASPLEIKLARLADPVPLSGFAHLLPFLGEQALWEELSSHLNRTAKATPIPGNNDVSSIFMKDLEVFKCPADPNASKVTGSRNYVFSFGDAVQVANPKLSKAERLKASRGLFAIGHHFSYNDCNDGRTGTLLLSETAIGTSARLAKARVQKNVAGLLNSRTPLVLSLEPTKPTHFTEDAALWDEGKGTNWATGEFRVTGFSTAIWPNMSSATGPHLEASIMSGSSHHQGGVNVAMADGSVRFVSDAIEAGGFQASSLSLDELNDGVSSPYGLWGSAGARSDSLPFESL